MAASTFCFMVLSRSEMDEPAALATSAMEVARFRLSVTACSELTEARCFWAMAQTEALSLAVATFRPVEICPWVAVSESLVLLRFCSASSAETLVLTLIDMSAGPLARSGLGGAKRKKASAPLREGR